MTKKVLVTGGGGFLARHVCRVFLEEGWDVLTTARKHGDLKEYKTIIVDFDEPRNLEKIVSLKGLDCIVHLAASVAFKKAPHELIVPNVLSAAHISKYCSENGTHLIFSSSIMVHGAKNQSIHEQSPICADTAYAESKYLAEQMISYTKSDALIVRFAGIFGDGGRHLGLNEAISAVLSGKRPQLIGPGNGIRNYVYVKDAAHMILHAAKSRMTGTCLAAGSSELSIREMIEIICTELSGRIEPELLPGALGTDQIVAHSERLPSGGSFRDSIINISSEFML